MQEEQKAPEIVNVQDFVTQKLECASTAAPEEEEEIDISLIKSKFKKKKAEVPSYNKVRVLPPISEKG